MNACTSTAAVRAAVILDEGELELPHKLGDGTRATVRGGLLNGRYLAVKIWLLSADKSMEREMRLEAERAEMMRLVVRAHQVALRESICCAAIGPVWRWLVKNFSEWTARVDVSASVVDEWLADEGCVLLIDELNKLMTRDVATVAEKEVAGFLNCDWVVPLALKGLLILPQTDEKARRILDTAEKGVGSNNVFIKRSAIDGDSSQPKSSAASTCPQSSAHHNAPPVRFIDLANAVDLPASTPADGPTPPGAYVPTKASQQEAEHRELTHTPFHAAPEHSFLVFRLYSGEAEALMQEGG
ncbi:unnamed protein product [Vitrella brassicaformis CCMP3155]|uniref:Uncharacterized protein n=1 Tax=Vitrella brassicaformis (strain CCMP3155) TaxID=1169540 RepID=A0A0G4EIH2_VITBC|nr:unnamed protein product [Vitrella brassicaformis CCMP3155]|eukprot:CEL95682.1 unnamed protein product [Vitrella brassicaformis CCMP3155]